MIEGKKKKIPQVLGGNICATCPSPPSVFGIYLVLVKARVFAGLIDSYIMGKKSQAVELNLYLHAILLGS